MKLRRKTAPNMSSWTEINESAAFCVMRRENLNKFTLYIGRITSRFVMQILQITDRIIE